MKKRFLEIRLLRAEKDIEELRSQVLDLEWKASLSQLDVPNSNIRQIPLTSIEVNAELNLRQNADERLDALIDSISSEGMNSPVIVRRNPNPNSKFPYQLISGFRRLEALRQIGPMVPIVESEDRSCRVGLDDNILARKESMVTKSKDEQRKEHVAEMVLQGLTTGKELGELGYHCTFCLRNMPARLEKTHHCRQMKADNVTPKGRMRMEAASLRRGKKRSCRAKDCIYKGTVHEDVHVNNIPVKHVTHSVG